MNLIQGNENKINPTSLKYWKNGQNYKYEKAFSDRGSGFVVERKGKLIFPS